ncbi:hypothetical protein ACFOEZ_08755 [Tianweitania populi]|uniref:hypothetical protein n=1 Tax=Tianweitania populi TaxID=1607949 RepID=UPI0036229482
MEIEFGHGSAFYAEAPLLQKCMPPFGCFALRFALSGLQAQRFDGSFAANRCLGKMIGTHSTPCEEKPSAVFAINGRF